jgi:hypothetical protein
MTPKRDYTTEAAKLAKAVDIAIEAFKKYPPKGMDESHVLHLVKVYSEWRYNALNPAPEYKKLSSLKYSIENVFTIFQERTGEAVEFFWRQIAKEELGYVREDKLRKVLDRGRIKGRLEFDYVTDAFIAAKQEGRVTEAEADLLSNMLGDFENRKRKQ